MLWPLFPVRISDDVWNLSVVLYRAGMKLSFTVMMSAQLILLLLSALIIQSRFILVMQVSADTVRFIVLWGFYVTNWTELELKSDKERKNLDLVCTCECVQTGGDWLVWGRAILTRTHMHPHTLHPRRSASLFPQHLGCCIESLGGPYCSPLLMHLLSLFSCSPILGMKGGGSYTLGRVMDWRLRKRESDSEGDIDTEREWETPGGLSFVVSTVKAQQGEPPWQFVRGATLIFRGRLAPHHCANGSCRHQNK